MPAYTATAPGKIILFGEHAVVYSQPAIAIPVSQVRARATVSARITRPARGKPADGDTHKGLAAVLIQAPDIALESSLADLPAEHPLRKTIQVVFADLKIEIPPSCTLRVSSTIPQAAGLGSGAAVSVAIIRALSAFLGHPLPPERVSALAFEVEKLYHGTPSGIDNVVITFNLPVYYIRGQPVQTLAVPRSFRILIADTGVSSPTGLVVGEVRQHWLEHPQLTEAIFSSIGEISRSARSVIENGKPDDLGVLMDLNQELLTQLGVSSPELDRLVEAARQAGALGAKLSGGGRGGNMIALAQEETAGRVARALRESGARHVINTRVGGL
jgi:mevalonate kinase